MGRQRWIAAALLLLMTSASAQTTSAPALDEALDAPTRAHIINEYARRLTEQHVDGPRAKAAADDLRKRLARGEYDEQLTARALAARVTRDLAAVAPDRHTYLEWVPYDLGDERQRPVAPAQSADNFGLRRFELMSNNIGYLKITRFAPLDRASIEAVGRFMAQAADCPALIIDVRDAGGDGQAMAALLSSYLLVDQRSYIFRDQQLHLHDQIDREGHVTAEYWTTSDVAGKRFGGYKPLYVLVNEKTNNAAEGFAYDLQQYVKRAVVVGAPTLGDARVGVKQRISRQLQTSIAVTRASNVITRANWEGMGVQPDRMTTSGAALDTALQLARDAILVQPATGKARAAQSTP